MTRGLIISCMLILVGLFLEIIGSLFLMENIGLVVLIIIGSLLLSVGAIGFTLNIMLKDD